jgi:hypothetical protein
LPKPQRLGPILAPLGDEGVVPGAVRTLTHPPSGPAHDDLLLFSVGGHGHGDFLGGRSPLYLTANQSIRLSYLEESVSIFCAEFPGTQRTCHEYSTAR